MHRLIFIFVLLATPFCHTFAHEPDNEWLTAKLYGSDNSYASFRKVKIFKRDGEYRVYIHNQFRFECTLSFDAKGQPAVMSGCQSRQKPTPICRDIHNPDTFCARKSNCFQSLPETKPHCYNNWAVKEPSIKLFCLHIRKEHLCRGKYTLINNDYQDTGKMTIAKRKK